MSVKKALNINNTADIEKRIVTGSYIGLTAKGVSVFVPLKSWNRYGLQTII